MIEALAFVLTGLGLTASLVYYSNILSNANKTRELQLKAQNLTLETRQGQLLSTFLTSMISKEALDFHVDHILAAIGQVMMNGRKNIGTTQNIKKPSIGYLLEILDSVLCLWKEY